MAHPRSYSRIDLEEITTRNETARHMIAGFSAEMPALAEFWRNLDTALTGNLSLSAEVTRLTAELTATRLDNANLLAAVRATLTAYADGEADPLYYLRDEVSARQTPPERHGGHHERLPEDAPPGPPGPPRRHAAHDGHQLR